MFTGDGAGLTTDTAVQVNDHTITGVFSVGHEGGVCGLLSLKIFTRTMSELLPVPSVKDREISVTEFRLGKFRSFAKGVAQ